MDIQIASNFERLIYDLNDFNDVETGNVMKKIKEEGQYIIPKDKLQKISKDFLSENMSETEVLNIIKDIHNRYNVILDPHSAIGFGALKKINIEGNNIVLATAHPCKFPEVIDKSIGIKPSLPNELQYIMNEKENYDIISNNINETQKYIKEKLQ
jgi:threonine synthase